MSDLDQFREAQDESLHPAYRLNAMDRLEASWIFLTADEKALLAELRARFQDVLTAALEAEHAAREEQARRDAPPVQGELF